MTFEGRPGKGGSLASHLQSGACAVELCNHPDKLPGSNGGSAGHVPHLTDRFVLRAQDSKCACEITDERIGVGLIRVAEQCRAFIRPTPSCAVVSG